MTKTQNILNVKLEQIRKNKEIVRSRLNELTKQREQAERNYIALDGAEQVLLELIEEANERNISAPVEPETEMIEEVSENASDNS